MTNKAQKPSLRPHHKHFVADTDEQGLGAVDAVKDAGAPQSQWGEAWKSLRKRPLFWISGLLILVACLMAAFPSLFTNVDPRYCELSKSLAGPESGHPFGFNRQGCDIYAREIGRAHV